MAETLLQTVIAHIKSTDIVRGRVWRREYTPQNATYPFCVVDFIGDQNEILKGDAQGVSYWQQLVQVTLFQEGLVKVGEHMTNRYDQEMPGILFRSFRNMTGPADGHKITVRLRSLNNIPQPEEELALQDTMTIEVTRTLEAI